MNTRDAAKCDCMREENQWSPMQFRCLGFVEAQIFCHYIWVSSVVQNDCAVRCRWSNGFSSTPFRRCRALDRPVDFSDLGSLEFPDNIPGKAFLVAHPYRLVTCKRSGVGISSTYISTSVAADPKNILTIFPIFVLAQLTPRGRNPKICYDG